MATHSANRAPIDFAGLMPKVSRVLLGEPNPRLSKGARLRFGAKGSMEVDTDEGWFDDHEANVRGGVLQLIQYKEGCDQAGAFRWLEDKGLKDRHAATLPPMEEKPAGNVFYDYRDASGAIAYRVERRGKEMVPPFLQHGPDGNGGFRSARGCMQGVPLLPYRLPELLAADPDVIVFVCEGEKDADRLAREGLIATTNSGGAGKFGADLAPHFKGRRVIVLADNDAAGEAHAVDVERKLRDVAASVAVLRLPDLPAKGDVSDWLRARGAFNNSGADLVALAEAALAGEAPPTLNLADLTLWSRTSATPTPFFVPGFIPACEVTLLTGAGGGNKSTFGQQLATCAAAGRQILGLDVTQAGALYVTAEDSDDRLHWMQEHLCRALGINMVSLAGKLHLASIRGRLNNELATFDHDGRMQVRETFHLIRATLEQTAAKLLVLDNVAHLFAGNENDRGQVTAFVNLLYALCRDLAVTVLLIAHKNKAGDSFSGSTAWLNAVRSQLVIERASEHDADARVLTVGKANYARPDQTLSFRWHDFALVRDEDLPTNVREEINAVVRDHGDDAVFLTCLAERTRQQQAVSEKVSSTYAPKIFAAMPESKRIGKERLEAAMQRLFRRGEIERALLPWQRDRKEVFGLRQTCADACADGAQTGCADVPDLSAPTGHNTHPYTTYNGGAASGASAPPRSDASEEWRENPALGRQRDLSRTAFPPDEHAEPTIGTRGEILAPGEVPTRGWIDTVNAEAIR